MRMVCRSGPEVARCRNGLGSGFVEAVFEVLNLKNQVSLAGAGTMRADLLIVRIKVTDEIGLFIVFKLTVFFGKV